MVDDPSDLKHDDEDRDHKECVARTPEQVLKSQTDRVFFHGDLL
jgi:hypothetical protein